MSIAEGLHPTQSTNGLEANGKAQRDDGVDREFTHGLVEGLHLCLQIRLGGGVGCSIEASLIRAGGAGDLHVHIGCMGVGGSKLEGYAEVLAAAGNDVREPDHQGWCNVP